MEDLVAGITAAVASLMFIVGVALLFSLPTMLLWDWLMPAIFGLPKISIFKAWGVNFLSGILFRKSASKD